MAHKGYGPVAADRHKGSRGGVSWFWATFGFSPCIIPWKLAFFLYRNAGVLYYTASIRVSGLGMMWSICSAAFAAAWGLLSAGQIWAAVGAAVPCAVAVVQWCGFLMFWILLGILASGYCV